MIPGEYKLGEDKIVCNEGYESITIKVKNIGDRAIQVGSQYHFYEANQTGLQFARDAAYGKKLDIPSGTSVRFEPGEEKEVPLIDYGGRRRIFGFNNAVDNFLDTDQKQIKEAQV
ncbi:urease subunit beta [Vagococcus jeotgali]|uniref:urease subunit beta n=1 Tax=Vagococcus jeotgali TaxID=3109030 RepID=UPI002DD8C576|nr:urease subunit beta [Vagococcus sp. B2T-5]